MAKDDDEYRQVFVDRDWWNRIAKEVGCAVSGWTYRDSAQFVNLKTGQTAQIPGWLGEEISHLSDQKAM